MAASKDGSSHLAGRNYHSFCDGALFQPASERELVPSNPSRALGLQRQRHELQINSTRIDGAQSINVWLPHEAAYRAHAGICRDGVHGDQQLRRRDRTRRRSRDLRADQSGTNDIHGAVFENPQQPAPEGGALFIPPGAVTPKLVYNEFGGAVGGPDQEGEAVLFRQLREEQRLRDRQPIRYRGRRPRSRAGKCPLQQSDLRSGDGGFDRIRPEPLPDRLCRHRASADHQVSFRTTPTANIGSYALTPELLCYRRYIFDRNRLDAKGELECGQS